MRALLLAAWLLGAGPALALNHYSANRIHLFSAGNCTSAVTALWLTVGSGQPAPGFDNISAPSFDQIAALVTGAGPATPEATLAGEMPACTIIASFYDFARPLGAWAVPDQNLAQLRGLIAPHG